MDNVPIKIVTQKVQIRNVSARKKDTKAMEW